MNRPSRSDRKAIKRAVNIANWYDDNMEALCNDPMTHAMGAPVGDFAEDWANKHRHMIAVELNHPQPEAARRILLEAMERYLP